MRWATCRSSEEALGCGAKRAHMARSASVCVSRAGGMRGVPADVSLASSSTPPVQPDLIQLSPRSQPYLRSFESVRTR